MATTGRRNLFWERRAMAIHDGGQVLLGYIYKDSYIYPYMEPGSVRQKLANEHPNNRAAYKKEGLHGGIRRSNRSGFHTAITYRR
jgi:hypothetical protein